MKSGTNYRVPTTDDAHAGSYGAVPFRNGVNASSKGSIVDTRIIDSPAFLLVGYAARVPLVQQGRNPHIEAHIAALPDEERGRLKALGDAEPAGLLRSAQRRTRRSLDTC